MAVRRHTHPAHAAVRIAAAGSQGLELTDGQAALYAHTLFQGWRKSPTSVSAVATYIRLLDRYSLNLQHLEVQGHA